MRDKNSFSGQLTATDWAIPDYAQGHIYLASITETVAVSGADGAFDIRISPNDDSLTVFWGARQGVVLACFRLSDPPPESLEWDGRVKIGGYVDALHMTQISGFDSAVGVAYFGGHPLAYNLSPYATNVHREGASFAPDFHAGLISEAPETFSTWLVAEDSPLMTLIHDAMLNNLRLHCFGRLAAENSLWSQHFAVPILLEAVTIFAP